MRAAVQGRLLYVPRTLQYAGIVEAAWTSPAPAKTTGPASDDLGRIPEYTEEEATKALQAIVKHVIDNRLDMYAEKRTETPRGWLGRKTDDYVAVRRRAVDKALETAGYHPLSMLTTWKDLGWLDTESQRLTKKVGLGNERPQPRPRCVCFKVARWGDDGDDGLPF